MLIGLDDYGQTNWVSNVKLLQSNDYIWTNQSVCNEHSFIVAFKQRLKDPFIQAWNSDVAINWFCTTVLRTTLNMKSI